MSEQDTAQEPKPTKYFIDESWHERQGRSLELLMEGRAAGLNLPKKKPVRKGAKAASRNAVIMEDLAQVEGFVTPELPILEAVFRLLLIHQNKPLDVEQINQELAERGLGVVDARVITPRVLTRLLDHDSYYGITRSQEP